MRVKNVQANKVLVLWDVVKPQDTNGQIRGYTIFYRDYMDYYYYYYHKDNAENITINDPNLFQMALSGLNGGSKYQIAVSAFTSVGQGPLSPWISFVVGECWQIVSGRLHQLSRWHWFEQTISLANLESKKRE